MTASQAVMDPCPITEPTAKPNQRGQTHTPAEARGSSPLSPAYAATRRLAGQGNIGALLVPLVALVLSAGGLGCQQQMTSLSGWVSEGQVSALVLLQGPEVELVSAPVVGATVKVAKQEQGKERLLCDVRTDRTGHFSADVLREPAGWARWRLTVEKTGYGAVSTGWRRLPNRSALYWRASLAPETGKAERGGVDTGPKANAHSPHPPDP